MYAELPRIREQLKSKLPSLLKEGDTCSVIWFSGRGESGVLFEAEPVATLTDLKTIHATLDRWLKPCGLTGFKEPLDHAVAVVKRIAKKNSNPFAFVFLSDGCDNVSQRGEILKAAEAVGAVVQSATFVEYGYYADRNLLTQMAEKCGGSLIFAKDFQTYAPSFEALMKKTPVGGKRIELGIEGDAVGGFAFAMADKELVQFGLENSKVTVPDSLGQIFYLSPTPVDVLDGDLSFNPKSKLNLDETTKSAVYAAISLFATRGKPDVVFPLLKATGDVTFINKFSVCFGKQAYSEYMDAAKAAAFDPKKRHTQGYDPNRVPPDDAFTVLHVFDLLQSDEESRILFNQDFKYNRIGRSRIDADELMTSEEQAELEDLTEKLNSTKDVKKIKVIMERMTEITDGKKDALKFVEDPSPEGFLVHGWTFNEDRPNVSFLIKKTGTVDLSARLPEEYKGKKIGKVPEKFPTHVFRNYAAIKDGLVNIEKLPVAVSKNTATKLAAEGVFDPYLSERQDNLVEGVILLHKLPVMNRKMATVTSAKAFFTQKVEIAKAEAAQKVYNAYVKELLPAKVSQNYAALYGDEAATWLRDQGLGDNGFAPKKTTTAEATDQYMAKKLKVSLKGLSSLPKVAEVRDKMASTDPKKSKLNAGGALMKPAIQDVQSFLESKAYTGASDKDKVLSTWLEGRKKASTAKCRELQFDLSRTAFGITVSQSWFSEFSSFEENTMSLDIDGQTYECKAELIEYEEKI
jgi:hypothetical protein